MCENCLVVKQKKTACITDILKEPLVSKLSDMSLSYYGTRRFMTPFKTACHWPLSWAR